MVRRCGIAVAAALLLTAVSSGQPGKKKSASSLPPLLDEYLKRADGKTLLQLAAQADFVKARRGELTLKISERGFIDAIDSSDIIVRGASKKAVASTIRWAIEDGSTVKKGDKLVALDDGELQDQLRQHRIVREQARAALAQATETLRAVQAEQDTEIRLGEIEVRLATLELDRAKDEHKEVMQLKVERAKLLSERTRAQARAKIAQGEADVAARRIAVDAENARTEELQQQLAACVILAPRDGLAIYHVPPANRFKGQVPIVAQGEPVRPGQLLMRVCDLARMRLVIKVHEAQIAQVKVGQTAEVSVDALPKKTFAGKVQFVAGLASQSDWFGADVRVYAVHVALAQTGLNLLPGMTGAAQIEVGTRDKALLVPASAVLRDGRRTFCLVKIDNQLLPRDVQLGAQGEQGVEIVGGLKEGDEVLRDPTSAFK